MTASEEKKSPKIMVKISKIQFPEVCPVCLEEPEDLVFVTIIEKAIDHYTSSSWTKGQDKSAIALNAAQGAVTFAIPTCMLHGSKSVRSLRTKLVGFFGFFVLFYPILFFLLQINVAIGGSRPLLQPVLGLTATFSILVILLIYSLFPRALERAIRVHDVSRAKDLVLLSIANAEYSSQFLNLNNMSVDIIDDETTETRG
jgi:hypothetical protein